MVYKINKLKETTEIKSILITGCNRGIGLELARQYAQDGWQVFATCRAAGAAEELHALASQYSSISVHALNVECESDIYSLSRDLAGVSIDVLLNNAGIYASEGSKFGAVEKAVWLKAIEVNTIAPLLLAQAFIDHVQNSQMKVIATVSSKVGSISENTSGGGYAYRSSKSAVNQVMKSLSIDLASRGIITVMLHPGWVRTDMGGPNALIDTEISVSGMRKVISSLTAKHTGQFFNYDGTPIPW